MATNETDQPTQVEEFQQGIRGFSNLFAKLQKVVLANEDLLHDHLVHRPLADAHLAQRLRHELRVLAPQRPVREDDAWNVRSLSYKTLINLNLVFCLTIVGIGTLSGVRQKDLSVIIN